MNEYEVATGEVLQFLKGHLKWPWELISAYGRVPVQVGSQTVWENFSEPDLKSPCGNFRYLLVRIGNVKDMSQSFNH